MATAIAPRTEVYLSLLAARAVTSLVRLAGDPSAWNQRIEDGLQDGIRYCQTIRAQARPDLVGRSSRAPSPLRRLVDDDPEGESDSSDDDSKRVEQILCDILSKTRRAQLPELAAAIEFLRKTATER
jgi:hypothetical protein